MFAQLKSELEQRVASRADVREAVRNADALTRTGLGVAVVIEGGTQETLRADVVRSYRQIYI